MAAAAKPGGIWIIFLLNAGLLILRFASAIYIPGGEWPLSPAHYLAMAIDAGLTIGLLGARAQLFGVLPPNDARRPVAGILFVLGLIAGIGLLAIRFTSDAAWWTGHLRNGLL